VIIEDDSRAHTTIWLGVSDSTVVPSTADAKMSMAGCGTDKLEESIASAKEVASKYLSPL
jgi:hypothetical protein